MPKGIYKRKAKRIKLICRMCNKEFEILYSMSKKRLYCSRKCYKGTVPYNKLDLNDLTIMKLYKSGLSMKQIGDKFNVSNATICNKLKPFKISRQSGFRKGINNPGWNGGTAVLKGVCKYCGNKISKPSKGRTEISFCNHKCCGLYKKNKKLTNKHLQLLRESGRKRRKQLDEKEIICLYESGLNLKEIGKVFNVSAVTINHRLDKNNIKKRLPFGGNGKDHYNWKGGINDMNKVIRTMSQYLKWRLSIYKRDNFRCQYCNKKGGILNAHHIDMVSTIINVYNIKNINDAKRCKHLWNTNNGITLCLKCHKGIHRKGSDKNGKKTL